MPAPWPHVWDQAFHALWKEGLSFGAIALRMEVKFPPHRFTRNMIAGKANGLGMKRGMEQMVWTPERVELLKRLWKLGEPCDVIARRLGCGLTAGAIGAKAKRLSLPLRRGGKDTERKAATQAEKKVTVSKPRPASSWKNCPKPKAVAEPATPLPPEPAAAPAPEPAETWTPEREQQLRGLVADGRSASEIAAFMGHLSRQAVTGKCYRLGLQLRGGVGGTGKLVTQRSKRSPAFLFAPASPSLPDLTPTPPVLPEIEAAPGGHLLTIDELTHTSCRWPFDPQGDDGWRYCGKPRDPRSTLSCYCPEHYRRSVAAFRVRSPGQLAAAAKGRAVAAANRAKAQGAQP